MEWRNKSEELRTLNQELEAVREDLNNIDAQQAIAAAKWDAQRRALESALQSGTAQVDEAEARVQGVEEQWRQLATANAERASRNEQHRVALYAKKDELLDRKTAAQAADSMSRDRLECFRVARDSSMKKLHAAIAKLQAAVPKESTDCDAKVAALEKRHNDIDEQSVQETRNWKKEVVQRRLETLAAVKAAVQQSGNGGAVARKQWGQYLQTGPHSQKDEGTTQEARALLNRLRTVCASTA